MCCLCVCMYGVRADEYLMYRFEAENLGRVWYLTFIMIHLYIDIHLFIKISLLIIIYLYMAIRIFINLNFWVMNWTTIVRLVITLHLVNHYTASDYDCLSVHNRAFLDYSFHHYYSSIMTMNIHSYITIHF